MNRYRTRQIMPLPPGHFVVHEDQGTPDGLWREPIVALALVVDPGGETVVYPVVMSVDMGPEIQLETSFSALGYEWPGQPKKSAAEWKQIGGRK